MRRTRRALTTTGIVLALTMTLAGCGTGTAAAPGSSSSAEGGVTIKAGRFSWSAAELEIEILRAIAADHPDLGVSAIDDTQLDPATAWVGLQRGDIDILPEVNLPNQQSYVDESADETYLASQTYDGATQGWFVPRYLVEGADAPAAGLTSVDQLEEYADKVGGALDDADPGWVTTQQNTKRLAAYAPSLKHNTSSEAALIAQLERSYSRQEPILLYFYHPHWLFQKYDLVQLEEPKAYTDGCFDDGGPGDCAIPTLSAHIAARKDLEERAPKFAALLGKVAIPLDDIEGMLQKVDVDKRPVADVAREWVDAHAGDIDGWIG